MTLFEWSDAKARTNIRKHGVSFELARSVFKDPRIILLADRVVDGEQRWQAIGSAEGRILLMVAHTVNDNGEDERIRIISARKASRQETRIYEEQD